MKIICAIICFSIGFHALFKQEIMVTSKKKWKGKSTLLLAIPLIALGMFMSWMFFEPLRYIYSSKSKEKQRVYQPNETEKKALKQIDELLKQGKEIEKKP
jgi:uncharacterized membrane protein YwzB